MIKKVLKFGGTSVGTTERIQHVANIIKKELETGNQVIAIVSAMSGKTNELVKLSKDITDDFNKRDTNQPYKRYKLTYYAKHEDDGTNVNKAPINPRYAIYKSKISWEQSINSPTGRWISNCPECYHEELIRDYVEDMEFVPLDANGKVLKPYPSPTTEQSRNNLYKVRAIDIRVAFKSEKPFFRFESKQGKERKLSGFSRGIRSFSDRNLRDNVVVTVHTRNIAAEGNY